MLHDKNVKILISLRDWIIDRREDRDISPYALIFMHNVERKNDYGEGNNTINIVIHNKKDINNISYKIKILRTYI
jgi:hypothetical protein